MATSDYRVRSSLPCRTRINCEELLESVILRHHCIITLTRCHWLSRFRINRINGDLIIHHPKHRQGDVEGLLNECLTLPGIDNDLQFALTHLRLEKWGTKLRHSSAVRNGIFVGGLLLAEVLLPIPLAVIALGAAVSLIPVAREIKEHWQHHRKLSPEILELAFTSILITEGHAGEALLEIGLGDASEAIEELSRSESLPKERSQEFVDRIRNIVGAQISGDNRQDTASGPSIERGDCYPALPQSHIFLNSTLTDGEIIVINRIVDGDWRPQRKKVGDRISAGSMIIKGSGTLRIDDIIEDHDAYLGIIQTRASKLTSTSVDKNLQQYNDIATPLLLCAGGLTMALGTFERSLGFFQFDPVNAWATSNITAKMTAIYSLGIQGVHINAPDSLYALSKVRHLVISRSCLDRIGGIKVREHLAPQYTGRKGELLKILAGLQNYLLEENEVRIWSEQLEHISEPAKIKEAVLNDLSKEGWLVTLDNGRKLLVREQKETPNFIHHTHLDPLEIWEDDQFLGHIELITKPGDGWVGVCEALQELGINIHVVGSDSTSRMTELVAPLGISHETNLHGNCDAFDRMELVRDLQRSGEGVAYLGYVLCDLPALTLSDVSICIDVDADSAITGSICDITLGADVHWLPRIIQLSRNIEKTATSNFTILAGSSLLAAIGATSAVINPLTTVLLSNLPIFLAELRNVLAMNSHGIYETHYDKERAAPPLPMRHPSCRLPSAGSTQETVSRRKTKTTSAHHSAIAAESSRR